MSKRWLGLLFLLVVWIGSSGVARAMLTETPDPIAIGTVNVGQTRSATGTLSANPAVTIATFDLSAAGCSEFQVTTAVPLTVGSGGSSQPVTVKLTPTSVGDKSCTIAARDAANAVLATFAATGTAVAPAISVSPSPFNFGSVRVDTAATTTATKQFTISNTGSAGTTLNVSAITFSGPSSADYKLNPPVTFPLQVVQGTPQTVTVELDPSAPGASTASMDLASDDPVTAVQSVGLSGTGTTAIIAVTDVNFGTVNDSGTGNQNITITNTATASRGVLTVTSATIAGGSFFSFGTTQGCSGGTSCTFTQPFTVTSGTITAPVRCQPPAAAAGTQTATVTFASDSDPGGDTTAQLTCTAGRPNIVVSTNTLAFGNVPVTTTSAPQTVTIMNTGTATLTYSLSETPNVAQYAISGCTASCTVAAGGMATFSVTFSPTAIGDLATRIDVTNDDPDPGDNVFSINASGTGTAPQIGVTPATLELAFASTEVGQTSTPQTVTATNTGNAPLTISSATFAAGGTDYTVVGLTGSQTIAPTASASWNIACKPSAQGARPGTFRIASDSLTGATTNVALTCTGQQGIVATNPTSLNFGAVSQGTTKPLTFMLQNTGNVPITGIAAVLDKTTVGYQFDPATVPATLAAGASTPLTVTFAPQSGTDGGPAAITFTAAWGSFGTATMAVLALDGDGLTAGYDLTPGATFDFGDFRFDTRPSITYHIVNTGQASIGILTQAFTPDAGTASGEIGIVIRKAGTVVVLPQTLAMGAQLDVTVTAQPNNRIGLLGGHIDIHSDLLMLPPDRRVTLTGNATTAAITFPAMVDFGAVDIDGPRPTQTIALTNTGTATLDINSIAKLIGGSPAFTVTLPTAVTHVVPGDKLSLTITYTPAVERPPNQFDTAVLVANLAGILGGPAQAMITLQGRGIDRHIVVDAVEAFPPTFRNPGSAAPTQAITVHNSGEATLGISALMIAGDPVWQLVDGSPVDLPGGGSHDFLVTFSPTIIGAAPPGQLTLVNNDNGKPMAMVTLTGNGIGRNVAFGPDTINLGFAGVGIPITAADLLAVTNMDPSVSFKIHAITLADGSAFRIDDAPADVDLPALTAKRFAITFEPTTEGDFDTIATLYLDQDQEKQAEVHITGHAVFVDAHGSGGCDAGGAGRGGGLAIGLAALGVVGVLRRRRRRRAGLAAAATALTATIAIAPAARADGIAITVFEPTPETAGTGFQLQSPEVGADGSWVASSILSYASNPLVLDARNADGTLVNRDTPITRSSLLQLGGAYAFLGRFEAGAHLPLYMQRGDPLGDAMTGLAVRPASGTATGNLTLHAKARLWRGGGGLGAMVAGASVVVVVPTATKDQFTGSDKPAARLLLLGAFTPAALRSRLTISANAGAIVRGTTEYANIAQQSGVAWGVGGSFRVRDALWATAEVFGEATPSGKRQQAGTAAMPPAAVLSPVEWLAGINYQLAPQLTIGLAAGRGVTDGLGTPDLRGVLSLAFVQGAPALAPIPPPEPPAPETDADGDGIADSVDKCPNEPEDKDMFDDADGCPDPDNDRDGVPDALDKCPLDPEDKDGFQDGDGCPEKDNDRDGIPDTRDKCPNEPEDKDGFQDLDGCPDPDDDHDGIPDAKDKCPSQPETINGVQDGDGCPDKGDTAIILSPDRIETLDPIQFTGVKLTRTSLPLLGQVAATLRAHTEIVRLRVTVHVQPTDDSDADQAKSDKRAQALRDWLVQWGIAPARLEARGFGGSKPLVAPDQRGAAKINDRLELIILERK